MDLHIESLEAMDRFAAILAKLVQQKDVICLNGDLGTGKTTFTKFFAAHLGIKEIVNSPTFNIIKCYFNKPLSLYHIDAYRLEDNNFDIGLDEYIDGDGVCVIEWGNFIKEYLPETALVVDITRVDENKRDIHLSGNERLIEGVKKQWNIH